MLTPAFELRQNDDFLIAEIKAPYAKLSEIDIFFEGNDFKFYCKPYFLRLNLPGKVLYEDEPSVQYDFDKGLFIIKMRKENPGDVYSGLDLLTKLLATKSQRVHAPPKIEVIGEVNHDEVGETVDEIEEFDWEVEQELPESPESSIFLHEAKCGFGNQYPCTVFKLKEEASEIFDFDPSSFQVCPKLRSLERLSIESAHFSEDHYLADFYEDEEIISVMKFQAEWEELLLKRSDDNSGDTVTFTAEEKERLRKLPNKDYLLDKHEIKASFLGLIDILFAYAYNKRVTEGENNVESAWNINKLSSTLSWLEVFSSISMVARSSVRRSLIYPLYRHWGLAMKVLKDTQSILSLGRKYVLRCMLEIHHLFCSSDPRYILNDIIITDYCVWLQGKSCRSATLQKLADSLGKIHLTKQDVDLDLLELECAAKLALDESSSKPDCSVEDLARDVANIKLNDSTKVNSVSSCPLETARNVKPTLLNSSTDCKSVEGSSSSDSDSSDDDSSSSSETDSDDDDSSDSSETDSDDDDHSPDIHKNLLRPAEDNNSQCQR